MLQIESLSLTFHGHDLIVDSELELNYGRYTHIASFISIQLQRGMLLEHVSDAFICYQAIWVAWLEWLWKIYSSHSNRLQRTSYP